MQHKLNNKIRLCILPARFSRLTVRMLPQNEKSLRKHNRARRMRNRSRLRSADTQTIASERERDDAFSLLLREATIVLASDPRTGYHVPLSLTREHSLILSYHLLLPLYPFTHINQLHPLHTQLHALILFPSPSPPSHRPLLSTARPTPPTLTRSLAHLPPSPSSSPVPSAAHYSAPST